MSAKDITLEILLSVVMTLNDETRLLAQHGERLIRRYRNRALDEAINIVNKHGHNHTADCIEKLKD